jgi:hypothetical protein
MDLSPAPPIAVPAPARSTFSNRAVAAMWFAGCVTLIALASWMTPNPDGLGTHRQLGMPPCTFVTIVGLPCATCGMTTAYSHAARGQLVRSFLAQPMGALLAVGTAAMAIVSGYALLKGLSLRPIHRLLFRPRLIALYAVIGLAAWVYKILQFRGAL